VRRNYQSADLWIYCDNIFFIILIQSIYLGRLQTIAKDLRLQGAPHGTLSSYHHLFWMGDLNYRCNFGSAADFHDGRPSAELTAQFQAQLARAQVRVCVCVCVFCCLHAQLCVRLVLFTRRASS
jgi:hypothetical protein